MNIRQIQQFVAVAEAFSFRKAAEELCMAQPPLTVAIRRLEEELGGLLFERHSQGVRITALGKTLLHDARQMLFHAEQIKKKAADVNEGIAGNVRIGFVGSANYSLFPKVLPQFRQKYPGITVDLREKTTTQILREVESGDLDLGLVRYPVLEPTEAELIAVEPDVLMVLVKKGHRYASKERLKLTDLIHETFVMYSLTAAQNLRGHVVSACQAAGFQPKVGQEAVQVQTIVSLVESGMGIALVPANSRRHAPDGVVYIPLDTDPSILNIALALVRNRDTESSATQRFRLLLESLFDIEKI